MSHNPYYQEIHEYPEIIFPFGSIKKFKESKKQTKDSPLVVDIGCGVGKFLRDSSILYPNYSFVGIEIRYKRLVKSALKFKKRELRNVRLIQSKGEEIHQWLDKKTIKSVHINFPDPWPKKRDQKRRLINSEYLSSLHSLLINNGDICFKTDHKEYFLSVYQLLVSRKDYKIQKYTEDLHKSPWNEMNIETEFEQLFKNQKLPIYYLSALSIYK